MVASPWSPQPVEIVRGPSPGRQWRQVARGLHVDVADPSADLHAWQVVLRLDSCFTHLTAASVLGWWLPRLPPGLPVFAAQAAERRPPRRAGLQVRRHPEPIPYDIVDGLRIARPGEVLLACASDMSLLDVVVMADAALKRGQITGTELSQAASRRRRGAPMLRQALRWVDGRSESPWETILRIMHVSAGIEVEPQREFWHHGRFVARADLWVVGTNAMHEYDGEHHRTVDGHAADLRRDRRIVEAGLVRRGYNIRDMTRGQLGILRDADAAIGRPHEPYRIVAWQDMFDASCWSTRGRDALGRRILG